MYCDVASIRCFVPVRFITQLTSIRQCMCRPVLLVLVIGNKFIAYFTFASRVFVFPHVNKQSSFSKLVVGFSANRAYVLFIGRLMASPMVVPFVLAFKCGTAKITFEWFFLRMRQIVNLQFKPILETFATKSAHMIFRFMVSAMIF